MQLSKINHLMRRNRKLSLRETAVTLKVLMNLLTTKMALIGLSLKMLSNRWLRVLSFKMVLHLFRSMGGISLRPIKRKKIRNQLKMILKLETISMTSTTT